MKEKIKKTFESMKRCYPTRLVLLEYGDMYISYKEDADYIATTFKLDINGGEEGERYVVFPRRNLDHYVWVLNKIKRDVVVVDWLKKTQAIPKNTKSWIDDLWVNNNNYKDYLL